MLDTIIFNSLECLSFQNERLGNVEMRNDGVCLVNACLYHVSGVENGVSLLDVTEFGNTHSNTYWILAILKEQIRVFSVSRLSGE